MEMKKYLPILICASLFIPLAAKAADKGQDFYGKLKYIESVRLNGLADTRKRLEELSRFESEFDHKELDLYRLLKAHSKAMQAEYDSAKEILTSLTLESDSIDIRSRAYSILAAIENIRGNDIDAFVALDNSLSQLSEVSDPIYRLDILQNAVGVYKEAELIEYALELSRRHLTEANRSNKNEPLCHANYELASIEIMAQKTKIAEERLKLAKPYCESASEQLALLEIEASLAEIAMLNEHYEKADRIMEDTYKRVELFGWDVLTSRAQIIYAEIYLAKDKLGKAEEYALSGYQIAKKNNDKKRVLGAAGMLAKIYSVANDNESAIKYYKEYMELNNELRTKVRQRKLAFQSIRETDNISLKTKLDSR